MSQERARPVNWVSHVLFLLGGMLLGYALARLAASDEVGVGQVLLPAVSGVATLVLGVLSARGRAW